MKQAIVNFASQQIRDCSCWICRPALGKHIVYWILWSTIMMRLNSRIRRFSLLQPLRKICRIMDHITVYEDGGLKIRFYDETEFEVTTE